MASIHIENSILRNLYRLFFLLLIGVLLGGCQVDSKITSAGIGIPITGTPPSNAFRIYFSDPTSPNAETLRGGPDKALADAIRQARLSVDIAVYDLDLWSIRDALLDVHRRGVQVRMVTDSDNINGPEIQDLKDAGIALLGDRREGLMHNKFVVIDGQEVWTGSMNMTLNSAYRNNDNLIRIHSPELALDYTTEFDEMFRDDRFGPGSPANTPNPRLFIDDSLVEVYFSPDDRVESQIIKLLRSAQKSIKFMAYSFTSDKIAQAMLDKSIEGVHISGVFEAEQTRSNQGSEYDRLRSSGLNVHLDGNQRNMHHKVIIIDDNIVITGSYNYTNNAKKFNDENLLVIHNRQVAEKYLAEFEEVYRQSQP
jgi:phosphatidylserine/phosphatidylglycerophosphate/cardiolipin synthase-like enzyme